MMNTLHTQAHQQAGPERHLEPMCGGPLQVDEDVEAASGDWRAGVFLAAKMLELFSLFIKALTLKGQCSSLWHPPTRPPIRGTDSFRDLS